MCPTRNNEVQNGRTMPPNRGDIVSLMGEFDHRLRLLFEQAGSPSLRLVASRIPSMTVQKVSDWRRGEHLPRNFESFEPLAVWLTGRAMRSANAANGDVIPVSTWMSIWSSASEAAASSLRSGEDPVSNPFRGLAPLTAVDAQLYFGREDLIAELLALIDDAAHDLPSQRIVIVTGASGTGKSSLLGAGLARGALIRQDSFAPHAIAHPDLLRQEVPAGHGPFVVDQFESLIASTDCERALAAVEALCEEGVVVLGVRADFFEACAAHSLLTNAWQRHCLIVGNPSEDVVRDVISGPIDLVGGSLEGGLVDAVIADVRSRGAFGSTFFPLVACQGDGTT